MSCINDLRVQLLDHDHALLSRESWRMSLIPGSRRLCLLLCLTSADQCISSFLNRGYLTYIIQWPSGRCKLVSIICMYCHHTCILASGAIDIYPGMNSRIIRKWLMILPRNRISSSLPRLVALARSYTVDPLGRSPNSHACLNYRILRCLEQSLQPLLRELINQAFRDYLREQWRGIMSQHFYEETSKPVFKVKMSVRSKGLDCSTCVPAMNRRIAILEG